MTFDINKWWNYALAGPRAPVKTTPPPKIISIQNEESEEEEEDDDDSGPDSTASKDIGTDDTMMDINTEVLLISHSSVLARPHPPPLKKHHPRPYPIAEVEQQKAEVVLPIPIPPAEPEHVIEEKISKPLHEVKKPQPPEVQHFPPSVKAKAIRKRKRPWYKRIVHRKTKEEKEIAKLEKAEKDKVKAALKAEKKEQKLKKKAAAAANGKDPKKKKTSLWKRIKTASPFKSKEKKLEEKKQHDKDKKHDKPEKPVKKTKTKEEPKETAQPTPKKKHTKKKSNNCKQQ